MAAPRPRQRGLPIDGNDTPALEGRPTAVVPPDSGHRRFIDKPAAPPLMTALLCRQTRAPA